MNSNDFARSRFLKRLTALFLACIAIHVHGQTDLLQEATGLVQTLAISPNGKTLVTFDRVLGLQLHSLPDYSVLPALEHPVLKGQPLLEPRGLAFSEDSKHLAIVHDRRLLVFELQAQKLVSDASIVYGSMGQGYGTAFLGKSQIAVSASGLGTGLVGVDDDGSTFSKVKEIGPTPTGRRAVFSATGKFVAMRGRGSNEIERYDLREDVLQTAPKRFVVPEGKNADVLAATSDGKFLAIQTSEFVSRDNAEKRSWAKVNLLSTDSGKSIASLPIAYGTTTPVAKFLPGTLALAIAAPGGGVELLDFSTGEVNSLFNTTAGVVNLDIDQSGTRLVSLDVSGNLRLSDLKALMDNVHAKQETDRRKAADANLHAQLKAKEKLAGIQKLRASIRMGDDTHCGMVVSVKKPIVEVQTVVGIRWFRVDQLFPIGIRECQFLNGVYQE